MLSRMPMREKNETKRDALRMLLTALKVKEKEIRRLPTEAETQQTITTLIKQRRDSAEQYKAGAARRPRRKRRS